MLLFIQFWTLEKISAIISIATPIILLFWFYYSQRQTLSMNYFDQVDGIYAGFTEPISKVVDTTRINAGIIMNIRDTDNKGYFKGEFEFAEAKMDVGIKDELFLNKIRDGIHTFLGKLDFEIFKDMPRHPYRPKENRTYKGTLYIVDRFDFSFEDYRIENYLMAEYDIIHYREMQVLIFTLKKTHRENIPDLPVTFTLHKKIGVSFEPYINVKDLVFGGKTRSERG